MERSLRLFCLFRPLLVVFWITWIFFSLWFSACLFSPLWVGVVSSPFFFQLWPCFSLLNLPFVLQLSLSHAMLNPLSTWLSFPSSIKKRVWLLPALWLFSLHDWDSSFFLACPALCLSFVMFSCSSSLFLIYVFMLACRWHTVRKGNGAEYEGRERESIKPSFTSMFSRLPSSTLASLLNPRRVNVFVLEHNPFPFWQAGKTKAGTKIEQKEKGRRETKWKARGMMNCTAACPQNTTTITLHYSHFECFVYTVLSH